MLNQAKVAMTFTTRERVMLPAMLEGEFSFLLSGNRNLPYADGHVRASLPDRQRCAHEDVSARPVAPAGTERVGEGDDAAAGHGRARTRTRRRATPRTAQWEKRRRTRSADHSPSCARTTA